MFLFFVKLKHEDSSFHSYTELWDFFFYCCAGEHHPLVDLGWGTNWWLSVVTFIVRIRSGWPESGLIYHLFQSRKGVLIIIKKAKNNKSNKKQISRYSYNKHDRKPHLINRFKELTDIQYQEIQPVYYVLPVGTFILQHFIQHLTLI